MLPHVRGARSWATVVSLLSIPHTSANGQLPPTVPLAVESRLPGDGFGGIGSVIELRSGLVLATDRIDKKLLELQWGQGVLRNIGRMGPGPGEFRGLSRVVAVGGDSALVEDPGQRLWILYDGRRLVEPVNTDSRHFAMASLAGAPSVGRFIEVRTASDPQKGTKVPPVVKGEATRLVLVQGRHRSRALDTLTFLLGKSLETRLVPAVTGGRRIDWVLHSLLTSEEQAVGFPDGWIAVARLEPYRVDWQSPAGEWRVGAPLPHRPVPITVRHKAMAMDEHFPGAARRQFTVDQMPRWPDHLPPFPEEALHPLADGRLLIARTREDPDQGTTLDVVDRTSRLTARWLLPKGLRLVGAGPKWLYAVQRDADELEQLVRLALPK